MNKMNQDIKQQLNLSIPSAVEYIIMTLISIVDTFAISALGSTAITAVGAMTSIVHFLNLIMKSIQVSNNAIIARAIGENDNEKIKTSTGTAVFFALLVQLACILITVSISRFIPDIFKVDRICLTYLYIRLISTIPATISLIVTGHLRTMGKSKQTMNIRTMSLVLNIILDYIAVKLGYGIAGVAWATVIIEVVYMVRVIRLAKGTIAYKLHKKLFKELFILTKYGVLDRIFDRGAKLILDVILSRLGTFEYAAHVILKEIENLANDFCYGFSIGITTNVGIKLGRKDENEIEKFKIVVNRIINVMCIVIPTIIFTMLMILLPILLKDKEALEIAYKLIPILIFYSVLIPIRYKLSGITQGMKEFKYNAKVSGIANIIKVLLVYILCKYIGIMGAWISFSINYIIMIIALNKRITDLNFGMKKEPIGGNNE